MRSLLRRLNMSIVSKFFQWWIIVGQISGLALSLMVGGCAGLDHGPLPVVSDLQRQQVLEALHQKEHTIRTLRGLFQASVSGSGLPFSQQFNGMMSYASPATVHFRGFLKFGVPMMDFHREGNAYELYFPAENQVITGQLEGARTPSPWDHTVQLSIRALDAVLGKIEGITDRDIHVYQGDAFYRLDMMGHRSNGSLPRENYLIQAWVDMNTLDLVSIDYRQSSNELVVSVECEDYREVKTLAQFGKGTIRLPFIVKATDHRPSGGSITLNFQEFVLNAA